MVNAITIARIVNKKNRNTIGVSILNATLRNATQRAAVVELLSWAYV